MLYYRGFIAPPVAVGEFTARFGLQDYLRALKTGIGGVLHGVHIPFVLIGVAAVLGRPSRAVVSLVATTFAAAAAHFIIFPLPETRYLAAFFVAAGIALGAMASEAANVPLSATEQAISRPQQIEMRQEQTLIGA
jgi:hypothetical protein